MPSASLQNTSLEMNPVAFAQVQALVLHQGEMLTAYQ